MANTILMLFEGEKTERLVFDSMRSKYFGRNSKEIVCGSFCHDIYSLYHTLKNDPYLEILPLLQRNPKNSEIANLNRDDVSEVYLFFDFDGHATAADDEKIEDMLNLFCEETESGKLYLSYPMVESLKHLNREVDFKDISVHARENIRYKNLVHDFCDSELRNFAGFNGECWNRVVDEHLKKAAYISSGGYVRSDFGWSPREIFGFQKNKYIDPQSLVSVVSAFPTFLADYFGWDAVPNL